MDLPPVLPDIPRVQKITVLGVTVNDKLSASDHVSDVINSCSRSLYALKILQSHGLTGHALHCTFKSVIVSKLLYCSPAWSGFTNAADRRRVDMFIKRSIRLGYCSPATLMISELFSNNDDVLFNSIINNQSHILRNFLVNKMPNVHNMRHRKHNFELIKKTSYLGDNNYLVRMVYKNLY